MNKVALEYIHIGEGQAEGGEGILLDQLAAQGLHCDSGTQLVVVCEARLHRFTTPLLNWPASVLDIRLPLRTSLNFAYIRKTHNALHVQGECCNYVGVFAASYQIVLDMQHADLRLLHPQTPLEGTCARCSSAPSMHS